MLVCVKKRWFFAPGAQQVLLWHSCQCLSHWSARFLLECWFHGRVGQLCYWSDGLVWDSPATVINLSNFDAWQDKGFLTSSVYLVAAWLTCAPTHYANTSCAWGKYGVGWPGGLGSEEPSLWTFLVWGWGERAGRHHWLFDCWLWGLISPVSGVSVRLVSHSPRLYNRRDRQTERENVILCTCLCERLPIAWI